MEISLLGLVLVMWLGTVAIGVRALRRWDPLDFLDCDFECHESEAEQWSACGKNATHNLDRPAHRYARDARKLRKVEEHDRKNVQL